MKGERVFLLGLVEWLAIGCEGAAAAWMPSGVEQSNELLPIVQDGSFGYVDEHRRVVIQPKFAEARNFAEGLACVQQKGRWGYINTSGRFVIEPQFDWAYDFSRGIARVGNGLEAHYIDTAGHERWYPVERDR